MAEGRGSAAIMLLLCTLVLNFHEMVHATNYLVGDDSGWTFNVTNWTDGKSFQAGDVLEFRYDPWSHNVLQVEEEVYNTCIPTLGSRLYFSGNDYIQLAQGWNYFICGFPSHCQQGMRIAINAA